ncbi:MAG: single-stranded-DNA-specific exonuclease RecJ [Blastocatellia bacterium]|nr:single-stranded-DNA-specific exonuclease RecJ [Blastocatellia bacterium]MDW8169125.1 single-stranded-DNA-specific exonuclease RecJ [Acidobacteriota bacterium]
MNCRWVWRAYEEGVAATLSRELGLPRAIARLLSARGVTTPEAAERFLRPRLDDLHDPYCMAGMNEAVERIWRALAREEPIVIYGDYDVDGVTSVVLLQKALTWLGARVFSYVPERLREGYGMHAEAIEALAARGGRLLISVDCGIRAHEVVERAKALGMETIVTDHHLPEAELPRAVAVLNPKRPDCAYPEKNLAGVGVALKLAQALLARSNRSAQLVHLLPLAAIGTIADVAPLVGENRTIARLGLAELRTPEQVGLRVLAEMAGLAPDRPVTSEDVAFRLAPRLNAVGRLSTAQPAIELLLTEDMETARRLAGHLNEQNARRQREEQAVLAEIEAMLAEDPMLRERKVLVLAREGWHRGVLGLVASKVVERFARPAVVLALEDEWAHGSGRSIPAFHLLRGLEACADLFERYGGHAHAAGLVLRRDRLEEFRERLTAEAERVLTPLDLVPTLVLDGTLTLSDVTFEFWQHLAQLEPFGVGNPRPIFLFANVRVDGEPRVLKDRHLKLRLRQAEKSMEALWWNGIERLRERAFKSPIWLAASIGESFYEGLLHIHLVIKDLSEAPPPLVSAPPSPSLTIGGGS